MGRFGLAGLPENTWDCGGSQFTVGFLCKHPVWRVSVVRSTAYAHALSCKRCCGFRTWSMSIDPILRRAGANAIPKRGALILGCCCRPWCYGRARAGARGAPPKRPCRTAHAIDARP